jgi:ankyrin repeat protein
MFLKRISIAGATTVALFASMMSCAAGAIPLNDALQKAAASGDAGLVGEYLSRGADIEARNYAGETPLLIATHNNRVEAARVLIEAGADVNAKDAIQDSPYLYAGARGHLEILRMALAHGANLKSTNRYGGTALIPAAERGHVETVRTLIEAGVDVNHINRLHWTALLEAIILGNGGPAHVAIVKLLVAGGADVNIADGKGVTPLAHARRHGYKEIERILVDAGAH